MTATAVDAPAATRREWIALVVLALPTLLAAMDFSVLFLAVPRLAADLRPNGSQLLWITDIYGFMVAGFLVTMGAVGSRIGQRRLLMLGAGAFAIASAAAAYSTSAGMLIAARAVLGIAGATLMPSVLGLISTMFRQPAQRATAIGGWGACLLAGTAIGPVVGGIALQHFWWGSVFLMGLPVMAMLMVTAPILLPEYRDPGRGRLDLVSVTLSLAAVLPIVYSVTTLARTGISVPVVVALMAGVASGLVFVYRQNRITSPLLDLRLLRYRALRAALGILLLSGAISGGISFLFAQYLQLVLGLSALRAGLWSLPDTAGMIACALLCPIVARHVRPGYVIGAGLAVSAAGFLALTQVQAASGLLVAVAGVVIVFIGVTPAWVLGTDLIVGSVPPEKGGSASSLSETSSELGVALGIAVIGSIDTAVYRLQTAHTFPAGISSQAAAAARDSLAGAVNAAARLRDGTGRALLMAARQAFTHGLNTAALAGIAIAAALALLAAVMLRHTSITTPAKHPSRADSARPTLLTSCITLLTSQIKEKEMLLENKNAIIYGAGGAIGGAVARAFARDGAAVFLAGRTIAPVRAAAEDISARGGTATAARVDALDEQAVEQHVADVARQAGRIDILFNAIGMEDVQGTALLDISLDDFAHPVMTAARTQFLTARAVARQMVRQGSGVIMSTTAEPTPAANLGGFMAACATVEALWRSLACELGPHGIRLVIVRSAGSPETPAVQEVTKLHAEVAGVTMDEYQAGRGSGTMLRRLPALAEVANAATLLASDRASAMTAAITNVTCGAFFDL